MCSVLSSKTKAFPSCPSVVQGSHSGVWEYISSVTQLHDATISSLFLSASTFLSGFSSERSRVWALKADRAELRALHFRSCQVCVWGRCHHQSLASVYQSMTRRREHYLPRGYCWNLYIHSLLRCASHVALSISQVTEL